MKRWNVVALRRGVQDLATDPERPPLLPVADNALLKVEPAEEDSDIPRRTIRRCRMGVVSLKRNQPVRAAETPNGAVASAAAAPVAPGSAVQGDPTQIPPENPLHTPLSPP